MGVSLDCHSISLPDRVIFLCFSFLSFCDYVLLLQSEYVSERDKRRHFVSGFTGSAGEIFILNFWLWLELCFLLFNYRKSAILLKVFKVGFVFCVVYLDIWFQSRIFLWTMFVVIHLTCYASFIRFGAYNNQWGIFVDWWKVFLTSNTAAEWSVEAHENWRRSNCWELDSWREPFILLFYWTHLLVSAILEISYLLFTIAVEFC